MDHLIEKLEEAMGILLEVEEELMVNVGFCPFEMGTAINHLHHLIDKLTERDGE